MLCFKTITAKTKNQSMHTQQETQHASPAILKTHEKGNTPCKNQNITTNSKL